MGKSSSKSMKELCSEIAMNACDVAVEYDCLKKVFDEEIPIIYEEGLAEEFLLAREVSDVIRDVCPFPEFIGLAASSMAAHLLYITNINPDKYKLNFKDVIDAPRDGYMWGYHFNEKDLYEVFKELKTHFKHVELSANNDCLTVDGLKIFVETSFERIRTIGLCTEHCLPF